MDPLSKYPPSTVGVRSTWTCATCKRTALNFQILRVDRLALELPRGWFVMAPGGHVNCGGHEEELSSEPAFIEGAD